MNDIQISKNFKLSEFESPDTKEVKVDGELASLLQQLREKIGRPLIINSAYRTKQHNKAVGGVENSQHRLGKAVDISLENLTYTADDVEKLAEQIGFKGIGKYNTFIHLDVREYPARWDNRE